VRCLHILTAGLLLMAIGCFNRATVAPETSPERKVVEKFLKEMKDDDGDGMKRLVSPDWLDENDIDLDDYHVNAYSPVSYQVTKVKGNKVTAEISFSSGSVHRLVFEVSEEDGKYFIVPGEADDDGWIHPWQKVETGVRK